MDSGERSLNVTFAPEAEDEFDEIWFYNAKRYGIDHADGYRAFLRKGIDHLAVEPDYGKPVEARPGIRAVTLKQRTRGYGHVAVYRVDDVAQVIRILHVYHTAQDWSGRLDREIP